MKVLDLDDKVLALAPQVLALALKEKSWHLAKVKAKTFPPTT